MNTGEVADEDAGSSRACRALATGRASSSPLAAGHSLKDKAGPSPARKSQDRKDIELCIQASGRLEQGEVIPSAASSPGTGTWLPFSSADASGMRTAVTQH